MKLSIIKFCAEEVERQKAGPIAVYNMCEAWQWATEAFPVPSNMTEHLKQEYWLEGIRELGYLVEPKKNRRACFRQVHVTVNMKLCPPPTMVPRMMLNLVNAIHVLGPQQIYKEFESIHPFTDGNGRVGKILFNLLNDSLEDPIMPENPFKWSIV